jgi:hypothetical protein
MAEQDIFEFEDDPTVAPKTEEPPESLPDPENRLTTFVSFYETWNTVEFDHGSKMDNESITCSHSFEVSDSDRGDIKLFKSGPLIKVMQTAKPGYPLSIFTTKVVRDNGRITQGSLYALDLRSEHTVTTELGDVASVTDPVLLATHEDGFIAAKRSKSCVLAHGDNITISDTVAGANRVAQTAGTLVFYLTPAPNQRRFPVIPYRSSMYGWMASPVPPAFCWACEKVELAGPAMFGIIADDTSDCAFLLSPLSSTDIELVCYELPSMNLLWTSPLLALARNSLSPEDSRKIEKVTAARILAAERNHVALWAGDSTGIVRCMVFSYQGISGMPLRSNNIVAEVTMPFVLVADTTRGGTISTRGQLVMDTAVGHMFINKWRCYDLDAAFWMNRTARTFPMTATRDRDRWFFGKGYLYRWYTRGGEGISGMLAPVVNIGQSVLLKCRFKIPKSSPDTPAMDDTRAAIAGVRVQHDDLVMLVDTDAPLGSTSGPDFTEPGFRWVGEGADRSLVMTRTITELSSTRAAEALEWPERKAKRDGRILCIVSLRIADNFGACVVCGKAAGAVCGVCRRVHYCGVECALKHRNFHRNSCKVPY